MDAARLVIEGAPRTETMLTRDGTRLDADVYRPALPGRYPVLLMRQPYGRKIASTVCYAHPAWYAAQGYIVAIQDVRGRGTSQGTFRLFADDVSDGADSVAWASALDGSTGAVGMYGFSYQGSNQLLAAASAAPALQAIAPAMIGWDLRTDWAYENDAFCLAAGLGWALQLAAESARLAGDSEAFAELLATSRALASPGAVPARPDALLRHRHRTHYVDWLDHPAPHAYWDAISPAAHAHRLGACPPALFVGGWYDTHLAGTLAAYRHLAAAGRPARLVIGPWAHFPWGRRLAGQDFGAAAARDIDSLHIAWFDRWLKGIDNGIDRSHPIELFDTGARTWREHATWPTATLTLHLSGTGRAAQDDQDGVLAPDPGPPGAERIVHDPWRPAPTVGGPYGAPPGPADRCTADARTDVMTFTTPPLDAPLTLAGDVSALLFAHADQTGFDLCCTLSRVTAGGQVLPLCEGYRHLRRAVGDDPVTVPMRATCATLSPGERLRLSIAGACFPAYPVNPGDGQDPTLARQDQLQITTITVLHGGSSASQISIGVAN